MREAFNAVFVECEAAGELMFYGRGAGGAPTASAVLGDIVAVARHKVSGGRGPGESSYADLRLRPMGETVTRYHVSLDVADRSGVLAQVATAFAEQGVSIETVRQEKHGDDDAVLVIVTHHAHRRRAVGDGRGAARASTSCAGCSASCGWRAARWPSTVARRHRRVRRPAAGRSGDAGRQPRRGRHPAGAAPATCPS